MSSGQRDDLKQDLTERLRIECSRCERARQPIYCRVGGDLGMKDHLHHEVAEFFGDAVRFTAVEGIERLIRFFEQEALERFVCLLEVPWTASVGGAQLRDDGAQSFEGTDVFDGC